MRRTLTLILAAVVAAVTAAAAQADTWPAPLTVPRSTTSSIPTQLLFGSNGRAAVVAAGSYGGKGQILRSEQFTDGQFLQFGRAFSGSSNQGIQGWAYDARGNGVMAGLSVPANGGRTQIALRATRAPGSTFAPRQEVSPGETQATTMRIAIGEGGGALVTWVARRKGNHRIAYVMRQPGHHFGARHYLSYAVPTSRHEAFHMRPVPAVDEHGNMAVTWTAGTHQRVAVGTVRSGFASSQDLGQGLAAVGENPAPVALSLRNGRGIVAFVSDLGATQVVKAAVSRRIGSGFSAAAQLDSAQGGTLGSYLDPAAAALGDGSFAVAARAVDGARIDAWTATSDGVFGSQQVLSPPAVTPAAPSLVGGADGRAIVAFGVPQTTGGAAAVYASTLGPGASTFGAASLVAAPSRLLVVIAGIGTGGRVGVAWNDGAARVSIGSAG